MKHIILAAALCCAATAAAAQDAPRVYELAEVETQPVPSNLEELRAALESTYPAEKRAAGQGARVSVAFVLGTDGVPRELNVTESTDAAFDSVTVAALGLLRFAPATAGGQPVAVRVEVPVEWEPRVEAATAAPADADAAPETSDGVRVYKLEEVDPQPRPTNLPALRRELDRVYPPALRDARIEGVVQVRFVITESGEVAGAAVTSSTEPRLNAATLEAVRVLRFSPGRIGRRAVRTQVELPIRWRVAEDDGERGPERREPGTPPR